MKNTMVHHSYARTRTFFEECLDTGGREGLPEYGERANQPPQVSHLPPFLLDAPQRGDDKRRTKHRVRVSQILRD